MTARKQQQRDRATLRGVVRSLTRAARNWRRLGDAVYACDLEREARIYLVQWAMVGGPVISLVPPPTSVTFYPPSPKKKGKV